MKHYDTIIINYGDQGHTLATQLSKQNKKVALIEENLTQSNSELYDSYSGIACFIDNHTLETNDNHILNANTIYTKTSAMQKPFDHIAILGGNVMGLECANLYSRYGSQVTIFERNYQILETEHPNPQCH